MGLNFNRDDFGNEICLYYKDDAFDMKNWMLYVHKQENNNYYTSVFHRTKCSKFLLERFGEDRDTFLIKETLYNAYLYINSAKPRDDNNYGSSYYVGACSNRNKASRFKSIMIEKSN